MEQLIEFANNNALLVTCTVALGLAALFYELRIRAGTVATISTTHAVGLINKGARVFDIRPKEQFDAAHIVDSINIGADDLTGGKDKRVKKDKTLVVVCDTGARSGQCAATLRKSGFEQAFSLRGGLANWQRENLPTVGPKS